MESNNKEEKLKKDLTVMRILKVNGLRYHIGTTDRNASIDLVINKETKEYQFFIDAAPLEKEENEAMLNIFGLN